MPRYTKVEELNLSPMMIGNMDVNPVTRKSISLYGESYALADIDGGELFTFQEQLNYLLTMPGSDERKIMLNRLESYVIGLRATKQALGSIRFTGLNAGATELGMGLIRPQFTQTAGAYNLNWNVNFAVANVWQDWLSGGAGVPFNIGQDFGLCVTHVKSLRTPVSLLAEARFVMGRVILIPSELRQIQQADTVNNVAIVSIPTVLLIPKSAFYARFRSDIAGADNIPLGGLIFGLGRALVQEVATWV